MTGLVEITDYDSAEAWLETQDHQTRVWFATRCALRAFPTVGLAFRYTTETVTLSLLRSMLISGSASTCLRKDLAKLRKAAASANASGQTVVSSIATSTHARGAADAYSSVGAAANSAVSAVASVSDSNLAYVAAKSAAGSVYSDEFPDDSSIHFSAMQRDTENKMLWPGLWHSVAVPNRIPTSWAIVSFLNKADPKNWDFWREWYEGILNGTPLPWDLTFEIATTLTDEDWEAGAAHVADRIREVRARFDVAAAIQDLRETKTQFSEATEQAGIGHNNPPELIDAKPLIQKVEIVWAALDDLETEAKSDQPDIDKAENALKEIRRWLIECCRYVGRKLDLAIDTTIKWAIPASGTGYFVIYPEKLQKIAELARIWLGQ